MEGSSVLYLFILLNINLILCLANRCSLHPSLWCSSRDTARACKVEYQCEPWLEAQLDSPPVNVELYLESLCPDCKRFIAEQLEPTWGKLASTGILNLTLIPYGNAHEKQVGNQWEFTCQHGERECAGNVMETCILSLIPFKQAVPVIFCMEAADDPANAAKQCLTKYGLEFDAVSKCANSSQGNQLEHQMALKTDALQPAHTYVPWVTIGGVHTEAIEQEAEKDLFHLICNSYTGQRPDVCNTNVPTYRRHAFNNEV
ncbi:gamma-interferon-inducible lysosomal thiol reductase-like [Antedon mediterranea]|uniref:gamma-interferon-inducible lysosomal thiol reductase-like n=1 Tax=Antedon mediterranea TaxID=105859 RepID=UPI003AF9A20A